MAIEVISSLLVEAGTGSKTRTVEIGTGRCVVVFVLLNNNSSTASITDDGGNTWASYGGLFTGSGTKLFGFVAKDSKACSLITAASNNSTDSVWVSVYELGGAHLSSPVRASTPQVNTSSLIHPAANVNAGVGDFVIGVLCFGVSNRTQTLQNPAEYTEDEPLKQGQRTFLLARRTQNVTVAGNTAPYWNITSGSASSSVALTFAIQAAPATATSPWSRWNGTTEEPLTLEGVWNGSLVVPITSIERAA